MNDKVNHRIFVYKILFLFSLFIINFAFLIVTQFPSAVRAQASFVTYCSTDNRINIEYPISWNRQVQEKSNPRVSFISLDGKAHVDIKTKVFNVANIPPGPDKFAGDAVQSYRNSLNNFTFVNGGPVSISTGLSPENDIFAPPAGYMILYTYNDPNLGPLKVMEVYAVSNSPYIVFDIEFYTHPNDFSNYEQTFQQMMDSFHVSYAC
jgi:hypothetical protein